MTSSVASGDFLVRLRRSLGVTAVLFLTLSAAMCEDDDDDENGINGPTADCLDEIDWNDAPIDIDEDDVQGITVGGSRSGSLTNNDIEDEDGYFYDIYVLAVDDDGEITINANPSGFDLILILIDDNATTIAVSDNLEDASATEEIEIDVAEGCYAIVISSYEEGETGSYTVEVD